MSGALITDTTGGWHVVTNTPTIGTTLRAQRITVDTGTNVINSGDAVTVTIAGVTNPGAGTYTDFAISTSTDSVGANAPSYTITAAGTPVSTSS